MTDLARWKLRGRVRRLTSELAEWDVCLGAWGSLRHRKVATFDPAGAIVELDQPGAEGTTSRSTFLYDQQERLAEVRFGPPSGPFHRQVHLYDGTGRPDRVLDIAVDGAERVAELFRYDNSRKTRRIFLQSAAANDFGYGGEASDTWYNAPGAVSVTIEYDEQERPERAVFRDAEETAVRQIAHIWDDAGRLIREEAHLPEKPAGSLLAALNNLSAEDRARAATFLAQAYASDVTTFHYDAGGRLVERIRRAGLLMEERTTITNDEFGNPTDTRTETRGREVRLNEAGLPEPSEDTVRLHHTRVEYVYDREGNWTECVIWSRFDEAADFVRSTIERRTLEYYP